MYITPSLENIADYSIKIINTVGIEYVKHFVMREYDFKKYKMEVFITYVFEVVLVTRILSLFRFSLTFINLKVYFSKC
jgi:hypothetical protein